MAIDDQISDSMLHAYVDGHLSPQQRKSVEAYLLAHPEIRRESHERRLLNQSLHELFDPALDRPVPATVLALLQANNPGEAASSANTIVPSTFGTKPAAHWLFQSIAAGVLVMVGGLLGWVMHGVPGVSVPARVALESLAVDAHRVYARETRHAVEVPAPEQKHLMSWLSARLGESVGPANLSALGYELLGGRLLPAEGKPAGMYLYRGAQEVTLTYYITSLPEELKNSGTESTLSCHAYRDSATTVCSWTRGTLLFFVIEDKPEEVLRAVSQQIREQSTRSN
jgi:anti-sigma factor RsiW